VADFTLGPARFPVGTEVSVFLREAFVGEAGPFDDAVTTGTTDAQLVTEFSGLAFDTQYWAAAELEGSWRRVAFRTEPQVLVAATTADVAAEALARADAIAAAVAPLASQAALDAVDADVATRALRANLKVNANDYVADFVPFAGPIEKAIDVLAGLGGGGAVELPAGLWEKSVAAEVPNFVFIEGHGEATVVRCTGDNYAFSFAPGNRAGIRNLQIDAASVQTSGGGIDFTDAQFNIWLSDIYFGSNLHTSLNIAPTAQGGIYTIERIRWNGVAGCTKGIVIGDGNVITSDVYISHACGTAATTADMELWIDIAKGGADTVHITDSLFFGGGKGMEIGYRGASGDATNHKFTSLVFDNCDEEGVDIGSCRGVHFVNCAVQGAGQAANNLPGVRIGAAAKMVNWTGGYIHECERDGILIANGSLGTRIRSADILNNNRQTVAFGAGITVEAGASDWTVEGCAVGNNIPGVTANQNYGIVAAGGAGDRIRVTGNDFPGNLTAAYTNSGVTGQNVVWQDNLPDVLNSKAAAATLALPPGDIITVTGNTGITSITASYVGRRVTLIFTGTPTVTDGSNLKLNGNLVASADDTLSLVCDGTNWIETSRSVN
jgi:hypothetical protein